MNALFRYCRDFSNHTGEAWNRFWFAPSDPYTASVMRILVGLLACWWLAIWTLDLSKLLGPEGWLSVARMLEWRGGRGFSLLDYASNGAARFG